MGNVVWGGFLQVVPTVQEECHCITHILITRRLFWLLLGCWFQRQLIGCPLNKPFSWLGQVAPGLGHLE